MIEKYVVHWFDFKAAKQGASVFDTEAESDTFETQQRDKGMVTVRTRARVLTEAEAREVVDRVAQVVASIEADLRGR